MQRSIDPFMEGTFDLVIVGGGITGAGVALEATLRGWRVGLIDKGDFASGTSSVSSKLVHGGLRYLEQGHFHLVYEALRERRWLVDHAPHLVRPLRFVLPFYQGQRVPLWQWRLGLTLYDLLAGAGNIRRSRPLSGPRLAALVPGLQSQGLMGGAEYFDAQMDDARLCLEVMQTAWRHGACVANYAEAVAFESSGGVVRGVRVRDRIGGHEFAVRGRLFLNASGPWVDQVGQWAGDVTGPNVRPSKGAHVIGPDRGLTAAALLLHPRDGRVFFVIPWQGKTLIGTTDTWTSEGPDELTVTAGDVTYLLDGYNAFFKPGLEPKELLGTFVGLRPLVNRKVGSPSARSREYRLWRSRSGLWSVAGGKYTTFRSMARQIVDRLGAPRTFRSWKLDSVPEAPWTTFLQETTAEVVRRWGLPSQSARHLVERYGARAVEVADYLRRDPNGAMPLWPGEPDLAIEILYQRDHEMAQFPADHLLRRTRLGLYCRGILENFPQARMRAA